MDVPGIGHVRFSNPEWLPALWGLLAIVVLYLLRRRAAKMLVPHLPIWEKVLARMRRRRRWHRVLFSLVLQLLIFAAAVVLLAGPYTERGRPGRGHTIVILDRSLGTRARDAQGVPVAESVLDRGRALLAEAAAAGPTSLAFLQDGLVPMVAATEDLSRLQAVLVDPGAPRGGRDLAALVGLRAVTGEASRIVYVTPFAPPAASALADARITVVASALSEPNAGIVSVRREGEGLAVRVAGKGGARSLRIVRDGRTLEEKTVTPTLAGTEVLMPVPADAGPHPDLVLDPNDAFPDDDRVPLAFPEREHLQLLVVSDTPTPWLDAFLEASVVIDVKGSHRAGSARFREWIDDYEVVVLVDDQQDLPLPPGRYLLLGSGAPELPIVRDPRREGPAEAVRVRAEDPLVRALDLARWQITKVATTRGREGLDVVVEGSTGPLISRARTPTHRIVDVAVRPDTKVSTLPLMAAFPLLLEAALIELAGVREGAGPPVYPAGGTLVLEPGESPRLETLDGRPLRDLRPLPDGTGWRIDMRPGRYRVGADADARAIAVAWLDHPGRPGRPLQQSGELTAFDEILERTSLRWFLLCVLLGALGLEWWLWNFRFTD
ncbi:MAG: hypothetical protein CMJ83_04745 [Planctomycetes bacterium]|nr:hypothetical protein [Planctomycetota bacterium]